MAPAPVAQPPAHANEVRNGSFWAFSRADDGLATIEYILGAAVVPGTLVTGVQAWNNGLVTRLQGLVTHMGTVREKSASGRSWARHA